MSEWIDVKKELPPFDDTYEICENPSGGLVTRAYYNGYTFLENFGLRVYPKYWRFAHESRKRYGKMKDELL